MMSFSMDHSRSQGIRGFSAPRCRNLWRKATSFFGSSTPRSGRRRSPSGSRKLGARRRSFLTAVILSVSVSLGSSVVLSAGVALSSPPFLISSNVAGGGRPAIASDGTNFFTVWSDPNTDSIFGARVGTDGTVLDPAGIAIYSTGGSSGGPPSVAFDGANFLVVWVETGFSILAVRVTPSGVVLDAPPIQIPPFAKVRPISLAFDGANYLVVWRNLIDQTC